MNDLVIIPQSNKSIIANIENDTIKEIARIDIPFNSKSIITKNELVVSLCYESNSMKIHSLKGDLILEKENTNYKAINFKENTVYFGGEYHNGLGRDSYNKGEMFSVINLEELELKINLIDLPIKIIEGKSIDDILINGNELILVDNIIYPKYLIKYDISLPNNPEHIVTDLLPYNGTYEHIIKGDINCDWMIIYSSTVGRGGSSQHITVSGKTHGHLALHNSFPPSFDEDRLDKEDNSYSYKDIALIKNNLYILRTDGLGFIDLNKNISNRKFKPVKTDLSNISRIIKSQSDKLIAVNESGYELINNEPLTKYKNNGGVNAKLKNSANNNLWLKFKKIWS